MAEGSASPRMGARRSAFAITIALVCAFLISLLPSAALAEGHGRGHGSHGHGGDGHHRRSDGVTVMTRNVNLGADLGPGLAATTPEQFFTANGGILRQVTRTNFPVRAIALADEIKKQRPDLVGLQEIALWRTAAPSLDPVLNGPSATTVRYDFLQLLLNRLNEHKPLYRAVVVQPEFDFEAPANENGQPNDGPPGLLANAEINGRLTMRDVILARNGTTTTTNPQAGHFKNLLNVSVSGIPIAVTRGWTTVDAKVKGGRWFHFVNTHLEAFDDASQRPSIRAQQAAELVAPGGPARSSLPVILTADLNSNSPGVQPGDEQAFEVMRNAGFVERDTHQPQSCCINDPNLMAGTAADFDHSVDHVMTSSPTLVGLHRVTVTGRKKVNGLWPSDHAGIASRLRLQR